MGLSRSQADRIIRKFGLAKSSGSLQALRRALQHAYEEGYDDGYDDGVEDVKSGRV